MILKQVSRAEEQLLDVDDGDFGDVALSGLGNLGEMAVVGEGIFDHLRARDFLEEHDGDADADVNGGVEWQDHAAEGHQKHHGIGFGGSGDNSDGVLVDEREPDDDDQHRQGDCGMYLVKGPTAKAPIKPMRPLIQLAMGASATVFAQRGAGE